jgi:hypothetical protein
MLKDMSYQKKFEILASWMPVILDTIKKDLRQEHLQIDKQFVKIHFPGKQIQKLTSDELSPAYIAAIAQEEGGEKMGEFIAVRWILKHSDVYHFFEKQLKQIDPKFDELDVLEADKAEKLMNLAIENFGAVKTYLFSVINSVVFPQNLFERLQEKAKQESAPKEQAQDNLQESVSGELLMKKHELEMKRTIDKYEKKLSGLQSKYVTDTENLKKQISLLQRKLHEYA